MNKSNPTTQPFWDGIRDGLPIALGYLAVSFSLGIACQKAGLNALQGFLISFFNLASAGEYAGITVIHEAGTYLEIAIMTLIANARYLLMSTALTQRFDSHTPFWHRFLIGYAVTDEIFGITIARPGVINPAYVYGAMLVSIPSWSLGTMLGVVAGDFLPVRIVTALSVSLFGMFLAIIIPPARKDKIVLLFVVLAFFFSYLFSVLPVLCSLSSGTRTILLTVVLSCTAAFFFPVSEKTSEDHAACEKEV